MFQYGQSAARGRAAQNQSVTSIEAQKGVVEGAPVNGRDMHANAVVFADFSLKTGADLNVDSDGEGSRPPSVWTCIAALWGRKRLEGQNCGVRVAI